MHGLIYYTVSLAERIHTNFTRIPQQHVYLNYHELTRDVSLFSFCMRLSIDAPKSSRPSNTIEPETMRQPWRVYAMEASGPAARMCRKVVEDNGCTGYPCVGHSPIMSTMACARCLAFSF